jgi:putative FmdB family regulatory protein
MPIYEYECSKCSGWFEVAKRIAEIDNPETCKCGGLGERRISRVNFNGASDWNNQTYHPGLGCYTRSDQHARQIAKARGLEEVGTEKLETIHKHFDRQREDMAKQRWAEADREKVYD